MHAITRSFSAFFYTHVIKRIFFLFDPETVHHSNVRVGKFLGQFAVTRFLVRLLWCYSSPQLSRTLDGVTFPNPVGLSAGFDYNAELNNILPAVGFGFHTMGTITLHPYPGNPKPRLGRMTRSQALLVNKGLKNDGAAAIAKRLAKEKFVIPTGISIASTNKPFRSMKEQIDDICESFRIFEKSKVKHAYYEMNISCPNTFGGQPFTDVERLSKLLTALDKLKISRPVYVKMPIDYTPKEFGKLLDVILKHNIQGVIIGNLTKDKTNPDVHPEDRNLWQQRKGNLSGKPTWNRSNTLIKYARKKVGRRLTIIGTGGIFSPEDAQHKLDLGADLVQLITGMIYKGPQLIGQINAHLAHHT